MSLNKIDFYDSHNILCNEIKGKETSNILISGGNSLKKNFSRIIVKKIDMSNVNLILSDERVVSEKSKYSNTSMIKKELLNKMKEMYKPNFIYPSSLNINKSNEEICNEFKNKIKFKPNLAFLGVGEDGHLASIFYKDVDLQYLKTPLLICKKNNEEFKRVSLDMSYLIDIPRVIFIILDKSKKNILKSILNYKNQTDSLPIIDFLAKSKGNISIFYNKILLDK